MELTMEEYRLIQRDLRHRFNTVGCILLVYYGIMNVMTSLVTFADMIGGMVAQILAGNADQMMSALGEVTVSAWGYFLSIAVGLVILLIWKKGKFWKEEIWAKGSPMQAGSFFRLLCVFLGGQCVYLVLNLGLELLLNAFGLSMMEGLNEMAVDTDDFGMFLYVGILAPISEELLFRGLIQRILRPYGRRFAILCSAFCFGIFHGNLVQSAYAFAVGLVLGYVADHYSIAWAMVLHLINNLLISDMLLRLTGGLPELASSAIQVAVILVFSAAALVILIRSRGRIREYQSQDPMNRTCLRCFFSCPAMIALTVVMGISAVLTLVLMLGPV